MALVSAICWWSMVVSYCAKALYLTTGRFIRPLRLHLPIGAVNVYLSSGRNRQDNGDHHRRHERQDHGGGAPDRAGSRLWRIELPRAGKGCRHQEREHPPLFPNEGQTGERIGGALYIRLFGISRRVASGGARSEGVHPKYTDVFGRTVRNDNRMCL